LLHATFALKLSPDRNCASSQSISRLRCDFADASLNAPIVLRYILKETARRVLGTKQARRRNRNSFITRLEGLARKEVGAEKGRGCCS
jgi:hypothetical protein